jgi:hypothetical protein
VSFKVNMETNLRRGILPPKYLNHLTSVTQTPSKSNDYG